MTKQEMLETRSLNSLEKALIVLLLTINFTRSHFNYFLLFT